MQPVVTTSLVNPVSTTDDESPLYSSTKNRVSTLSCHIQHETTIEKNTKRYRLIPDSILASAMITGITLLATGIILIAGFRHIDAVLYAGCIITASGGFITGAGVLAEEISIQA